MAKVINSLKENNITNNAIYLNLKKMSLTYQINLPHLVVPIVVRELSMMLLNQKR